MEVFIIKQIIMNKFIILEEERERILDMHKSRTSNQYLNEEPTNPTGTDWYTACITFNKLGENKKTQTSFSSAGARVLPSAEQVNYIYKSFGSPNGWCKYVNNFDQTNFNQSIDKNISKGGGAYKGYEQFPKIVEFLKGSTTNTNPFATY